MDERQRGSALLLIPSLFMVLLLATGLVVDGAIAFAAQRDLAEAAGAAANDAADAVDEAWFYADGEIVIDLGRAQAMADAALSRRSAGLSPDTRVTVDPIDLPDGEVGVEVTAEGTVHLLFSRLLPFGLATRPLRARARAATRHLPSTSSAPETISAPSETP